MRHRVSPGRSTLTVPGVLLLVVLLLAVGKGSARNAELTAVVGAFAVALLAVGIVWPVVVVRRARVSVVSPRDITVGDHVAIRVVLSRAGSRLELRVLDPASSWHRARAGAGDLEHVANRRGVFTHLRIEFASSAPLGLFVSRRVVGLPLDYEVSVSPRAASTRWDPVPLPSDLQETTVASRSLMPGDVVRSVRPYMPGDSPRAVHWPTTVRTGALAVREMEPPGRVGTAVALHLRMPGPSAEAAASRAMGLVLAVLAAGGEVVLCTCEAGGPVVGHVTSRLEAGRRLARAVPGAPAPVPPGWPLEAVDG